MIIVLLINPSFSNIYLIFCYALILSFPYALNPGGRGTPHSGEGPGREAGDTEDEADGGQSKAEGAGEAQDPAGAAAGVENQDARAAG